VDISIDTSRNRYYMIFVQYLIPNINYSEQYRRSKSAIAPPNHDSKNSSSQCSDNYEYHINISEYNLIIAV
jgi:hypothetical protein